MILRQRISGYHQDELGDWVAELECGHQQHVRHQPPWFNRPWAATGAGRRAHIGSPLECPYCDREGPPPTPSRPNHWGRVLEHVRNMQLDGFWALCLAIAMTLSTLGLSLLPFAWHVLRVARRATCLPSSATVAAVFGVCLRDDAPGEEFVQRLRRGLSLLAEGRVENLLLLGGVTGNATRSEAQAGRAFLLAQGVAPGRIFTEDLSRHTLENLRNARDLARERGWGVLVLVSSRYHLARVGLMAGGLSMAYRLCGAEDRFRMTPDALACALREAFYLQWYWCGKVWSLLTHNRKSLERIS